MIVLSNEFCFSDGDENSDNGDEDGHNDDDVNVDEHNLNHLERNWLQEGRAVRNRVVENYCF